MADGTFDKLVVSDSVGIGTDAPNAQLHVNAEANESNVLVESGSNGLKVSVDGAGATIGTINSVPLSIQTDGMTRVVLVPNGNMLYQGGSIGIGHANPNPDARLDVQGPWSDWLFLRQERDVEGGGGFHIHNPWGNSTISQGSADRNRLEIGYRTTAGNDLWGQVVIHGPTGNVGIGTLAPYAKLTMTGAIGFTNNTTPMMYIFESGTTNPDRPIISHSPSYSNWGLMYRDSDDTMIFQSNGNPVMSISLNDSSVTVHGKLNQASSRTLKSGIAELPAQEAISALTDLNPVKFRYKEDPNQRQTLGFIAEEVPDLVSSSDRQHISPMEIIAVLTKVVQEQQVEISAMQAQIQSLQSALAH